MRIAVIGATGKAGKLIVQEAVNRSHEVTAISRRPHPNTPAQHTLVKNVTDLTTPDFKAVDVVISALGSQQIVELTTHLGQILSGTDTRLVVIGGTGTLYTTPARTERLVDSPNFPAEYRKYAEAHAAASTSLRGITGLKWTAISPAANFLPDAPARHDYEFAGDVFTVGASGISEISYADYASALVDEAENTTGTHIGEQISVRNR